MSGVNGFIFVQRRADPQRWSMSSIQSNTIDTTAESVREEASNGKKSNDAETKHRDGVIVDEVGRVLTSERMWHI